MKKAFDFGNQSDGNSSSGGSSEGGSPKKK